MSYVIEIAIVLVAIVMLKKLKSNKVVIPIVIILVTIGVLKYFGVI